MIAFSLEVTAFVFIMAVVSPIITDTNNEENGKSREKRGKSQPPALPAVIQTAVESTMQTLHLSYSRPEGESLDMACVSEAARAMRKMFPDVEARWRHNGKKLKLAANRMKMNGDNIHFKSLRHKDTGTYTCEMEYFPDSYVVVSFATVAVSTNRTTHLANIESNVDLICKSSYLDSLLKGLKVAWHHNGSLEVSMQVGVETYRLMKAQEVDSGEWKCRSEHTKTGRKWTTNWLRLRVVPKSKAKTYILFGLLAILPVSIILYFLFKPGKKSVKKKSKSKKDKRSKKASKRDKCDLDDLKRLEQFDSSSQGSDMVEPHEAPSLQSMKPLDYGKVKSRSKPKYMTARPRSITRKYTLRNPRHPRVFRYSGRRVLSNGQQELSEEEKRDRARRFSRARNRGRQGSQIYRDERYGNERRFSPEERSPIDRPYEDIDARRSRKSHHVYEKYPELPPERSRSARRRSPYPGQDDVRSIAVGNSDPLPLSPPPNPNYQPNTRANNREMLDRVNRGYFYDRARSESEYPDNNNNLNYPYRNHFNRNSHNPRDFPVPLPNPTVLINDDTVPNRPQTIDGNLSKPNAQVTFEAPNVRLQPSSYSDVQQDRFSNFIESTDSLASLLPSNLPYVSSSYQSRQRNEPSMPYTRGASFLPPPSSYR